MLRLLLRATALILLLNHQNEGKGSLEITFKQFQIRTKAAHSNKLDSIAKLPR